MEKRIEREEELIDLVEIFHLLLRKAWMIIICFVIGAVIAGCYTKFMITPQYSAKSIIYILTNSTSITSMADIQLGTRLTVDFQMLVKTRPALETVIEDMGLNLTYEQLAAKIQTNNPDDSRFLEIIVTDSDPERAKDIANAVSEVAMERIARIMDTEKPNVVEEAVKPQSPISPNLMKNTMMGAIVGAGLMALLIIVLYLMDDTLKTEEDVRKYLKLNTLAAIPVNKRKGKAANV